MLEEVIAEGWFREEFSKFKEKCKVGKLTSKGKKWKKDMGKDKVSDWWFFRLAIQYRNFVIVAALSETYKNNWHRGTCLG